MAVEELSAGEFFKTQDMAQATFLKLKGHQVQKVLWEHETTAGWRKNNPWDSDDPYARRARLFPVERASVVLVALGGLLPANPEAQDA